MKLEVVEPVELDGRIVSSSLVRRMVAGGDAAEARRLLGQALSHSGAGHPRGRPRQRTRAFPPPTSSGRYAAAGGRDLCGLGAVGRRPAAAALSIGPNPTFHEQVLKVEAHVLDFAGDLYDRPLEVDFLARLRDIKRFDAAAELVRQMANDMGSVRRIFAQGCP